MMAEGTHSTAVLVEQAQIARKAVVPLAAYVVISTLIYVVVDLLYPEENSLYLVSAIVVWGMGFLLLGQLMQITAPSGETLAGGIGSYFGLGLISGTAIGVALVLLIVPGLYLMLRWLPSYARLFHKREGVIESMRWSWDHTEPFQGPLAIAMVGPVAAYVLFFGIGFWYEFNYLELSDLGYQATVIGMNLSVSVAVAWFQLLGVAAYRFIQRRQSQPVEVFE